MFPDGGSIGQEVFRVGGAWSGEAADSGDPLVDPLLPDTHPGVVVATGQGVLAAEGRKAPWDPAPGADLIRSWSSTQESALRREMLSCEGCAFLGAVTRIRVFVDQLETGMEAAAVGDLDCQARSGIELQDQGAVLLVEH